MPIVKDDSDMKELDSLLTPYKEQATISWGYHPVALPRLFGIITERGISKKQATIEIAEYAHIKLEELLGIGEAIAQKIGNLLNYAAMLEQWAMQVRN